MLRTDRMGEHAPLVAFDDVMDDSLDETVRGTSFGRLRNRSSQFDSADETNCSDYCFFLPLALPWLPLAFLASFHCL